jgi:hypothetical protein
MSTISSVTIPTKTSDTVVKIGDNEYNFDIILYNANKEFTRIKNSAIKELLINDNLLDFGHKGTITFQNNLDNIEKIASESEGGSLEAFTATKAGNSKILPYYFRGDARDFLIINITPNLESNDNLADSNNFNYKDEINEWYKLKFVFAIYETEDILTEKIDQKYKKLYFWDSYYQLLTEKNSDFTTAEYVNQKDVTNLNDVDRGIKTGLAVRKFLEKFFPKEEGFLLKLDDIKDWDEGTTTTFYSSPACTKGKDDLDYLTNLHVSNATNKFDFAILRKERYTEKISFRSMSYYFSNAYKPDKGGKLHLERFILPNATDPSGGGTAFGHIKRAPTGDENNAFFADYSMIQQYQFHSIAGMDQQNEFVTNLVHSYDFNEKMFNIDTFENTFEKMSDTFNELYVKPMKGESGKNPASTITKNEYRVNNRNFQNTYSVDFESKEKRIGYGRNAVLRKALFLNNAITFTVRGLTLRRSGRFISIDRNDSYQDNKFDDKLLGTYFITNVNHKFNNGQYINEVTAIKPYLFKDPKNTSLVL